MNKKKRFGKLAHSCLKKHEMSKGNFSIDTTNIYGDPLSVTQMWHKAQGQKYEAPSATQS